MSRGPDRRLLIGRGEARGNAASVVPKVLLPCMAWRPASTGQLRVTASLWVFRLPSRLSLVPAHLGCSPVPASYTATSTLSSVLFLKPSIDHVLSSRHLSSFSPNTTRIQFGPSLLPFGSPVTPYHIPHVTPTKAVVPIPPLAANNEQPRSCDSLSSLVPKRLLTQHTGLRPTNSSHRPLSKHPTRPPPRSSSASFAQHSTAPQASQSSLVSQPRHQLSSLSTACFPCLACLLAPSSSKLSQSIFSRSIVSSASIRQQSGQPPPPRRLISLDPQVNNTTRPTSTNSAAVQRALWPCTVFSARSRTSSWSLPSVTPHDSHYQLSCPFSFSTHRCSAPFLRTIYSMPRSTIPTISYS